ncbi:MAG: hypothetical protein NW241_00945 [Bacteroidia bacterium]|nr:hypothetical protein [Bacteroidia bacterium]
MHTAPFLRICAAALSLTLLSLPVRAQLPRIQNRVENKVNQKVNQSIDRAVDKSFDALERAVIKKATEKDSAARAAQDSAGVKVQSRPDGGVSVETQDSKIILSEDKSAPSPVLPSNFQGSFTMEFNSYKNGKLDKDNPIIVQYHVDEYRFAMVPQPASDGASSIIIYDRQKRTMTTKSVDSKGKKTATVMNIPRFMLTVDAKGSPDAAPASNGTTVKATGRTKTIEGFLCKEWIADGPESSTTMWITTDWAFNYATVFDFVKVWDAQSGMTTGASNQYQVSGSWLEMHTQSKKEDSKTDNFIKNIRRMHDASVFSLDGYEVSDMTNMFGK